jgi:hypothetical protein
VDDAGDLRAGSLFDSFRDDFREAIKGVPNLAVIVASGDEGRPEPSPDDAAAFNARTT